MRCQYRKTGISQERLTASRRKYTRRYEGCPGLRSANFSLSPYHGELITSGCFPLAPMLWLFALVARTPIVVRVFGGNFDLSYDRSSRFKKWFVQYAFRRCNLILFQTRHLCNRFSDFGNVRHFPTVRKNSAAMQRHSTECRRFLLIAQLRPKKGIKEALVASDQLPSECSLTVYGPIRNSADSTMFAGHEHATYAGQL